MARINHRVRSWVAALILLVSATALARPRVQVAPFVVRGDESLSYFGPEVARAVAAALEGAGIETGAGGELGVNGHVEILGDERVRLTATLRGHTLSAEGPLEAVDAVATQLANKLAPLLLENDPAAQRAAERRAREAEKRAAAVPTHKADRASETAAKSEPRSEPQAAIAPAEKKAEPPAVTTPPSPPTETASAPPAESAPKAEPKPEPREAKSEWSPPRVDGPAPPRTDTASAPPAPPAPPATAPSYPPPPSPFYNGFVRGRIVAHAIPDLPTAYPGVGVTATQALFGFLHRRMRLSVVPTGVGLTSTAIASDEAYRAGARAVVMARLETVEYFAGPSARVRLELVVVRDGRPVMRRVVESVPTSGDARGRGAAGDPVFQAVNQALEALVPELVGALADVR